MIFVRVGVVEVAVFDVAAIVGGVVFGRGFVVDVKNRIQVVHLASLQPFLVLRKMSLVAGY